MAPTPNSSPEGEGLIPCVNLCRKDSNPPDFFPGSAVAEQPVTDAEFVGDDAADGAGGFEFLA